MRMNNGTHAARRSNAICLDATTCRHRPSAVHEVAKVTVHAHAASTAPRQPLKAALTSITPRGTVSGVTTSDLNQKILPPFIMKYLHASARCVCSQVQLSVKQMRHKT